MLISHRHDDDFASVISSPQGYWQNLNWDPAVNDPTFYLYCDNITTDSVIYAETADLTASVENLISVAGYGNESDILTTRMLNFIGWLNMTIIAPCVSDGSTEYQCFTSHNSTYYEQDDLSQDWRSWPYQYCTEWGFLQTGSGVPADQLPLVSRLQTLEYESLICRYAFNITTPPDLQAVNKYGGWDVAYDRLAFIDGEWDPWRPATPHAPGAKNRTSTASRPFILMSETVHHWDENGLFPNETTAEMPPQSVADTQKLGIQFVEEWMEEWQLHCMDMGCCG